MIDEECQLHKDLCLGPFAARELEECFDDNTNWGISADVGSEGLCCDEQMYKALADAIPKNRVIYDFGASYGFQSWYFRNHRRYIAIQPQARDEKYQIKKPFRTDNSIWYFGTIQEFFKQFDTTTANRLTKEERKELKTRQREIRAKKRKLNQVTYKTGKNKVELVRKK